MRRHTLTALAIIAFVSITFAVPLMAQGSVNGHGGLMPAYYDGNLFTINFKELPAGGEMATLAHNKSYNNIY